MKRLLSTALLSGALFLAGCGDSRENFVFTNPNNNVTAPVAQADFYTTDTNAGLSIGSANGVLVNDTLNGAVLTGFTLETPHGQVTLNSDGSFTYTPDTGYAGTDTFTYTITNTLGSSTATVTITIEAISGYFVDSATGVPNGDFDDGTPFDTIQAAVAAAPTGETIVVRVGDGSAYSGAVNLKNGQRLLGAGSALVNAQSTGKPLLTGPVVLADGNTLDSLRIEGTNGPAVNGSDHDSGTVTNCDFADTTNTGAGVGGLSVSGSWVVSNNTFSDLDGTAVFLSSTVDDESTIIVNNNSMTSNGLAAIVLVSEDASTIKAQVHSNEFSGNNTSMTGDAFEVECRGDSHFGLDLEDNINDGVYSLFVTTVGSGVLSVEQLNELTVPKANGGAGNTGDVQTSGNAPTPIDDGTLFPE